MNYNLFLNKQIINKNNETGIVLSFDKDHIVIKYPLNTKTYNSDVSFRTGFLSFKNKDLKQLIDQSLFNQNIEAKKKEQEIIEVNKKYFARRKKVNETYKRLCKKNKMLLALFGRDFIYPPLKEFEKKYKYLIDHESKTVHYFSYY